MRKDERLSSAFGSELIGMRITTLALLILTAMNGSLWAEDPRPNVLLMMADDLGYSDLGCFGGEIDTPNIDSIAEQGLLFSQFRASPMCVTSRIALMSGMPMHRAGQHSYRNSVPLPIRLKKAGYRTMMTGKWHAGKPDPRSRELFDRGFGFLGGATDSFAGGNDWFLDENPFREFGPDFYSTHAFADRSIAFMKEAERKNQPFFMYVAFNAPHHPCQAPQESVEKYTPVYSKGYEVLREQRRHSMENLGLLKKSWKPVVIGNEVRKWDELTVHRRSIETQRMAAYAACIDEVDQSVGRMLDFLEQSGIADNTLVIFLSDNGADYNNGAIESDEKQVPWKPGTNPSSSNGWASVKCSPFRYYKHSCHEGGLATPMVMRWPAGIDQPSGTKIECPTNITDLYPTLLELAGIGQSKSPLANETHYLDPTEPVGHSLVELFTANGEREASPVFQWYQFSRAWIERDWKAVSLYGGPWRLYDLKNDRCEVDDKSDIETERLQEMVDKWHDFAAQTGVPESNPVQEIQRGWGWHRLQMAMPALESVQPNNGSTASSTSVTLKLRFQKPIDFANTAGRRIYLYDVSDESKPVWESDPDTSNPGQGKLEVVFSDIPRLLPNHQYNIRFDAGWIRVDGRPSGPLNDGAYWWRFRTPSN